jgi:L-ascorbate metabolism protein UlaG (beta-lactamase superfamily)
VKNSRVFLLSTLFIFFVASRADASCRDIDVTNSGPTLAYAAEADATIQYFGHNFFQITTKKGTRFITDPLAPGMYPTPDVTPHAVTVGREHPNHNYVQLARGTPVILRGLARYGAEWNRVSMTVRDVFIYNIPIYQNGVAGAIKGAAFIFDLGTLCIAHLGDLSHTLAPDHLKQIGRVDVALIPIGGRYTMGPETAREVLLQLKPRIAIPMHYRDNLFRLESFLKGMTSRRPDSDTLVVSKSSLPTSTEIIVLTPQGARGYR